MPIIKLEKKTEPDIAFGEYIVWYYVRIDGLCKIATHDIEEARMAYKSVVDFYRNHRQSELIVEILEEETI